MGETKMSEESNSVGGYQVDPTNAYSIKTPVEFPDLCAKCDHDEIEHSYAWGGCNDDCDCEGFE